MLRVLAGAEGGAGVLAAGTPVAMTMFIAAAGLSLSVGVDVDVDVDHRNGDGFHFADRGFKYGDVGRSS